MRVFRHALITASGERRSLDLPIDHHSDIGDGPQPCPWPSQFPHCERFGDLTGVTFNVPLAVEARRPSTIVAEASRLVPMAHVPSLHVPPIPVRSIPVRSIPIGSVPVPSLPVRPVPIRSAPVLIAALAPETAFHMKSACAASMKAGTSSSDGVRPRQEDARKANSSDGDNCSRGHQLHISKRDRFQASRTQWSGKALSLPQSANSTASPIKQLRWLKMLADTANAADGIY
jgi:hypothetical protein